MAKLSNSGQGIMAEKKPPQTIAKASDKTALRNHLMAKGAKGADIDAAIFGKMKADCKHCELSDGVIKWCKSLKRKEALKPIEPGKKEL